MNTKNFVICHQAKTNWREMNLLTERRKSIIQSSVVEGVDKKDILL